MGIGRSPTVLSVGCACSVLLVGSLLSWSPVAAEVRAWVEGLESLGVPGGIDPGGEVPVVVEPEPFVPHEVDVVPVVDERVSLTAGLDGGVGEFARAGVLPVRLRVADAKDGAVVGGPVGVDVVVSSLDAGSVEVLGGEVLAFRVQPVEVLERRVVVDVEVDYSGFRYGLGGDWGERLRLVEWSCAVPGKDCGEGVPVDGFVNDAVAGVLRATVVLDPLSSVGQVGSGWRLAGNGSTLGLSSAAGSFERTSLSNSGKWQVGGNRGAFSYSVPVVTPPAFNGLGPVVSLEYSSDGANGVTSAVNSQASEVGIGWSLSAGQGFIERRYLPCSDTRVVNANTASEDSCWYVQNATISLNGHASELVPVNGVTGTDTSFTQFRLKDDPDWLVERVAGSTGSWWQSEHWRVLTPDGFQYWFGRNDETQNSRLTRPVRGISSGTPCNGIATPSNTCVDMPYRWMLDAVEDPFGNRMIYKYELQKNKAEILGAGYSAVDYDMGALLKEVLYGKAPNGSPAIGGYRAKVEFSYVRRCTQALSSNLDTDCPAVTNANGTSYPDVPTDLYCQTLPCYKPASFFHIKRLSGIATYTAHDGAMWSRVAEWRLAGSFPPTGDGSNEKLWLWVVQRMDPSVTPVGAWGTPLLAGVVFDWVAHPNRRDYLVSGGVPPMNIMRISDISDDLGQRIQVTYGSTDCSSPYTYWATNTTDCYPMKASYPGAPPGDNGWGVYRRWKVIQVVVSDLVAGGTAAAGAVPVTTTYAYTGAAWHHDGRDWWIHKNGVDDVSFGDFRGYRQVVSTTGTAPAVSVSKQIFYQGMHGDENGSGGTRSVQLTKSWTTGSEAVTVVNDEDWLQGAVFESFTMDGTTSNWLTSTRQQSTYMTQVDGIGVRAGSQYAGGPLWLKKTRKWRMTLSYTRTVGPSSSVRDTRVDTTFDALGRAHLVQSTGFLDVTGDESCQATGYITSSGLPSITGTAPKVVHPGWMNLVAQTNTWALLGTQPDHSQPIPAGVCNLTTAGQLTGLTRTFYNNQPPAAHGSNIPNLPAAQTMSHDSKPTVTAILVRTQTASPDVIGNWRINQIVYDGAGRVVATVDPNSSVAGTGATATFVSAGNTPLSPRSTYTYDGTWGYQSSATYPTVNSIAMTVSTNVRPADGQPNWKMDQNLLVTNYCYDSLFRLTKGFLPRLDGAARQQPCAGTYTTEVPNVEYIYSDGTYSGDRLAHPVTALSKTPFIVVTSSLQSGTDISSDVRVESADYIDGFGRTRETQTASITPNTTLVTATLFDPRGLAVTGIETFAIADPPPSGSSSTTGAGDRTSPTGAQSNGFATWPALPSSPTLNTNVTTIDTYGRTTRSERFYGTTSLVATNIEYSGQTTITKPQLGSWTSTTVDALGRTITSATYNGTTAPTKGLNASNDGAISDYTYSYEQTAGHAEAGWLTVTASDDASNLTTTVSNMAGQTIKTVDPNAGATTIAYDANGNITSTTTPSPTVNLVCTSYDILNRPTLRWSKAGCAATTANTDKLASWTYDYPGTSSGTLGFRGMAVREVSWQGGYEYATEITEYTRRYQIARSETQILTNPNVPTAFVGEWRYQMTFDEAGHAIQVKTPIDKVAYVATGGTQSADPLFDTINTHYNGFGLADQLSGSTYHGTTSVPTNYVTGSIFDALGRPTMRYMSATGSGTEAAFVRQYAYDTPTGALNRIQAGWDPTPSDLTGIVNFQDDQIARDAIGRITTITDAGKEPGGASSDNKECFIYDNWNRLVRAHSARTSTTTGCLTLASPTYTNTNDRGTAAIAYDRTWTFDDINRIRTTIDKYTNVTSTYTYTGTKHAVTATTNPTASYTYNDIGSMTTHAGNTLTWDKQNRLTQYGTTNTTNTYTTTNQRLIRKQAGVFTLYLAGLEIAVNGANTTKTIYRTLAGTTIATETGYGTTTRTTHWDCGNHHNSTTCQAPQATTLNPATPQRKRYLPYGQPRDTTTYTTTDHNYLGQPKDTNNLIYLNNRYHDPTIGAFISVDPLVSKTGQAYLYANGAPATLADPSGLCFCSFSGFSDAVATLMAYAEAYSLSLELYMDPVVESLMNAAKLRGGPIDTDQVIKQAVHAMEWGEKQIRNQLDEIGAPPWTSLFLLDEVRDNPQLLADLQELDRIARMPLDEFEDLWEDAAENTGGWDWTNDGCSDGGYVTGHAFGCVRHDFVYRNNKRLDDSYELDGAMMDVRDLKGLADSTLNFDVDEQMWIPGRGNVTELGVIVLGTGAWSDTYASDENIETVWGYYGVAVMPDFCGGMARRLC